MGFVWLFLSMRCSNLIPNTTYDNNTFHFLDVVVCKKKMGSIDMDFSIMEDGEIDLGDEMAEYIFFPRWNFKCPAIGRGNCWSKHGMGEFLNLDADGENIFLSRII